MTNEEIKKVIQAEIDGKKIEMSESGFGVWVEKSGNWNFDKYTYRIKKKQVRLYTKEEYIKAVKQHGPLVHCRNDEKEEYGDTVYTIVNWYQDAVTIIEPYSENPYEYDTEFCTENWIWADDRSPFGIEENWD